MDYRHRKRLKLWGRATFVEGDPMMIERLRVPGYQAEIERVILFQIEAWNWNCPQHIPIRYSEREVAERVAPLEARIAQLEKQLASLSAERRCSNSC